MAEELAYRSSASGPLPRGGDGAASARGVGTFPAGSALAALGVWFVLTRVVVRFTMQHPGAAKVAMFAGAGGAVLAALALVGATLETVRDEPSAVRRALGWVRLLFAVPVAALVFAAVFDEPPALLQWLALGGAAATVTLATLAAVVRRAPGMLAMRGALALLLVGELAELVIPPVMSLAPGEPFWVRLVERISPVSELATLVGAALAVAWAYAATNRAAGAPRTRMFLPLPIFVSVVLSYLAFTLPERVAAAVARSAFGVRFDLLTHSSVTGHVSKAAVLLYLLIPELLFCASSISLAGLMFDRGAAARRALGWVAVLLAGFGALRLAGPMDPMRLVLVALGAALLERAAAREALERTAPG